MDHKKKFLLSFILLILLALGSIFSASADYFGLCGSSLETRTCIKNLDKISSPIFSLSSVLAPFFLILAFLPIIVFHVWKKFAQIYIPISIILVLLAPDFVDTGIGVVGYGFDKETTTWWLSGIFFVVSLIIITRKALKLQAGKK